MLPKQQHKNNALPVYDIPGTYNNNIVFFNPSMHGNTHCVWVRGHLIGLQKICFQKIKNQNWALIGRSVTSTMVIFIFRKICFQPRNPGGLFFLFSGCLFYSKFMRCAPPSVPHIQSALVPPSLPRHTREHTGKHAE